MKILSANQIKLADAHTIKNEPVKSIELMERAATVFVNWYIKQFDTNKNITVYCGLGNNGGDGLAITRLLHLKGYTVKAIIVRYSEKFSEDFAKNEKRLLHTDPSLLLNINESSAMVCTPPNDIIIDAILGTGISRPVKGFLAKVLRHINSSGATIISVDIPSGLPCDLPNHGGAIAEAHHTVTFELPKYTMLFPQNGKFTGDIYILSIGLDKSFIENCESDNYFVDGAMVSKLIHKRLKFSHKGNFGHALLVAGGYGKAGAAILATRACLRAGAGLLSVHVPGCAHTILQTSVPEAMLSIDRNVKMISSISIMKQYDALGIGPGIGTEEITAKAVRNLIKNYKKPIVLDADALNILSLKKKYIKTIPEGSILTPHLKEFERMFGKSKDDFSRLALAKEKAEKYKIYIVLKGAHTVTVCPDGKCYFNSTGNPGMATGGSGDVLLGIITGLMAQGYSSLECCLVGVYLHGLAGDIAAEEYSQESMIAGDIIEHLGDAFRKGEREKIKGKRLFF